MLRAAHCLKHRTRRSEWQARSHRAGHNNTYIFPGLALGILVSRARRVTDAMIMAAAKALASLSPALAVKSATLLPPIAEARNVSLVVAEAVGKQAVADGVAEICATTDIAEEIRAYVWESVYRPYMRIDSPW